MQPDANYEPNPVSSAAGPDPRVSPTSDPATRGAFHLAAPPSSLEVLRGPRTQGWSEAGEESEPRRRTEIAQKAARARWNKSPAK